jgi:hypothetical protein
MIFDERQLSGICTKSVMLTKLHLILTFTKTFLKDGNKAKDFQLPLLLFSLHPSLALGCAADN